MKILLLDIETTPNISYTWGKYEQDVIAFLQESYILSISYKWLGDKKVQAKALPNFSGYTKNRNNDKKLIEFIWELLDEADIVIAQNGDRFDLRKINARFLYHGLTPPSPYKTVDTLKLVRKYFMLNSNRLGDVAKYLGIGGKVETGGHRLWLDCMAGIPKAWTKMIEYNKQDVVLLEEVYMVLRTWATNHPNLNHLQGTTHSCPNCGSDKVTRRGFGFTKTRKYQRFQCNECHAWSSGETIKDDKVIIK